MSRMLWPASALAVALLAACAGSNGDDATTTAAAAPAAPPPAAAEPAPDPAPAPAAPTSFTDAQLRSFAAAATQINPIAATLQTATPEQRTAAVDQIRTILQTNNIDEATYNAIASRLPSDPALAARIQALHQGTALPNG